MLNLLKSKIITTAFVALTSIVPAHAAVLNISDDGQLLGATNVDVNGMPFDVSFAVGSCASLFDGCDANDDFFFDNEADALAAAQALLDDVFIEQFEADAELIFGIGTSTTSATIVPFQIATIPTSFAFAQAQQLTRRGIFSDSATILGGTGFRNAEVFREFDALNFALFSVSQAPTPNPVDVTSPATFGIFTLVLLGLGLRRKLNQ